MVYIGLPNNPQFVGPQDPRKLAMHIWRSKGPSGDNKEYLYMLDKALQDLDRGSGDKHVEDLVARVKAIEEKQVRKEGVGLGADIGEDEAAKAIGTGITKIGSADEQEEVEKVQQ